MLSHCILQTIVIYDRMGNRIYTVSWVLKIASISALKMASVALRLFGKIGQGPPAHLRLEIKTYLTLPFSCGRSSKVHQYNEMWRGIGRSSPTTYLRPGQSSFADHNDPSRVCYSFVGEHPLIRIRSLVNDLHGNPLLGLLFYDIKMRLDDDYRMSSRGPNNDGIEDDGRAFSAYSVLDGSTVLK